MAELGELDETLNQLNYLAYSLRVVAVHSAGGSAAASAGG